MQLYRLDSGSSVAKKKGLKIPADKKLKSRQQCVFVINKANNVLLPSQQDFSRMHKSSDYSHHIRVGASWFGFSGCWHVGMSPAEPTRMASGAPDVQAEAEGSGLIQP